MIAPRAAGAGSPRTARNSKVQYTDHPPANRKRQAEKNQKGKRGGQQGGGHEPEPPTRGRGGPNTPGEGRKDEGAQKEPGGVCEKNRDQPQAGDSPAAPVAGSP